MVLRTLKNQNTEKILDIFITSGDIVTVSIDFKNMQLRYYHQDALVGSLSVESIKEQLLQGT